MYELLGPTRALGSLWDTLILESTSIFTCAVLFNPHNSPQVGRAGSIVNFNLNTRKQTGELGLPTVAVKGGCKG